ncbi:MAG: endolytic transglycosylase MltG [Bacteroidota bacterium]
MATKKSNISFNKKVLYTVLALVAVLLFSAAIKIYEDVLASNIRLADNKKGYVYVGTHLTLEQNKENWKRSGLFRNLDAFVRVVKVLGFESKLKPGRYEVDATFSNYKIIRLMASGRQTPVDVTFKYAERKEDLVQFWSSLLEADSSELGQLLNDASLFEDIGLDTLNSVCIFIPNTYNFYWNTPAEDVLLRMKKEYRLFWNDERKAKAEALHLTPQQVSILASIVQKETYQKSEMPIVAGVYYNRLKKGMPFQADPTILYAINDKSVKRVGGIMLHIESPYNTYKYTGLIPGPICVPSVQAIDAVLNLQRHNYIYFCAKEDFSGFHNFAATFSQHQVNARKYQRELNRRGIR